MMSERANLVIFEVIGLKDACHGKVLVDIDDALQKRYTSLRDGEPDRHGARKKSTSRSMTTSNNQSAQETWQRALTKPGSKTSSTMKQTARRGSLQRRRLARRAGDRGSGVRQPEVRASNQFH